MWAIIRGLFTLAKMKELWDLFQNVFKFFFDDGYKAAVRIAKFALVEVGSLEDLTNEEKRIEAWGRIKDQLGKEGMFVKDNTINKAIEDVLGWLKAQGVL